jgi:hypothetical protein
MSAVHSICSSSSLSSSSSTTTTCSRSSSDGLFWQENNLGVQCLNNGDYVQAFHCFRSALVHCKANLNDFQQQQQSPPQHETPTPEQERGLFLPPFTQRANHAQYQSLQEHACSQGCCCIRHAIATPENSPFINNNNNSSSSGTHSVNGESINLIHTRAIPMVATTTSTVVEPTSRHFFFFSNDPFQETNICSAVIVFNLGLVFHLQALQNVNLSFSHKYLIKALTLYQQAGQLLQGTLSLVSSSSSAHFFETSTGNALVDLVIMAILNNSANLSLMLLESSSAHGLFGQLIRFALSVRVSSALYRESQWIDPMNQRVDSFLFHAMFSQMYNPTPSAAAA